jgi:hypothetical protein
VANPWFRMYSEFSHDPKVQTMSEAMQRRYTMIMCMRCSNDLVTLHETDIAFYLRISDQDLAETKALFIKKGFVDSEWNLLNWEKRQFSSDTSNARVAKHRALQKEKQLTNGNGDVTLQKRKSNALEQNRTDTEEKNTSVDKSPDLPNGFAEFWKTWPTNDRKQAKGKCLDAWKKAHAERDAALILAHVSSLKNSAWTKDNGQFVPAPLVYLNQRRWEGADTAAPQHGGLLAGAI